MESLGFGGDNRIVRYHDQVTKANKTLKLASFATASVGALTAQFGTLTPPTDFDRFLDVFLLRTSLGLLLVVLGLGYLLDPKAILRLNALMREVFFKDSHVLLNGKRIGTYLIFLGFLILALCYKTQLP